LLFGAVRQINKKQLGLVGRTTLGSMDIAGDNLERLRVVLSERTGAAIPAHEAQRWITCQDVCQWLADHGAEVPESAEEI
jgi:hypothetical protein